MREVVLVHVAVVVPRVGEAIAEVTLVEWVVKVGDAIAKGDILFTVDTEKATVDIESFVDGTLIEILVPAGGAVLPGQNVGIVAVEPDRVPFDADVVDPNNSAPPRVTAKPDTGTQFDPSLPSGASRPSPASERESSGSTSRKSSRVPTGPF